MAIRKTLAHFRFDEANTEVRPSDEIGGLADLITPIGFTSPAVVDAFTGFGRQIGFLKPMQAADIVAGSTLATRDVTVQAILQWDFDTQVAVGSVGAIIMRGIADGTAGEVVSFGVELRVVNAASRIGELRFRWQEGVGIDRVQSGGQFVVPTSGYMMLTATRHWISANEVELQYYVGDQLVGTQLSITGIIGGATTGTTTVGARKSGGVFSDYFVGILDELRVLNYHVTQEEVEATWLRLSKWQPSGYSMIRQLFQPRAPISDDPASRVQKLFRGIGHAIGYASAQIDNMHRNLLPDRAYGPVLERWERITKTPPKETDTIVQRRRRVVGHLSQRQGVSPPGVRAATADLLQLAQSQIELLAFSNDITEDFTTFSNRRWWANPAAQFTLVANALRVQAAAASDLRIKAGLFEPTLPSTWYTCLQSMQGDGVRGKLVAKMTPTTLGDGAEVGICFLDWTLGNIMTIGLRNNAGVYQITGERWIGWVSQGGPQLLAVSALAAGYFVLGQDDDAALNYYTTTLRPITSYTMRWGATLATLGAGISGIAHPAGFQWAGLYARSHVAAIAAAVDCSFDDVVMRQPFGDRTSRWYAYRDPALPGTPDLIGAQLVARRLAHAQTVAGVISTKTALCDDARSICDSTPMGAI